MIHYRILLVNRLRQVVQRPVRVDGRCVRVHLRQPFLHPLFAHRLDLARNITALHTLATVFRKHRLYLVDELPHHQLRVADHRHIGRIVLVHIVLVIGDMHEHLAVEQVRAVMQARETAPDAEHHIRLVQVMHDHARRSAGARAQRKRMVLTERALARHRGHHRRLRQFRQLPQLFPRLGVQHALPGMYDRVLRAEQNLRGIAHVLRIARGSPTLHRHIRRVPIGKLTAQYVAGQVEQHGAGASHAKLAEGTPQGVRNLLRQLDPSRPLHH